MGWCLRERLIGGKPFGNAMESTTPAAPSVAYREPARKRPSSRWTTVVAAAAIAGVVITAILLVLLLPRTPLSLCHGCPPGLLVGGNSLTSPGSPGCVDHPSEICYSFPVYTAYGPVSLSGLTFCLRESYTNSSIVQVGAGGTVGVIDASHGSVAVWSSRLGDVGNWVRCERRDGNGVRVRLRPNNRQPHGECLLVSRGTRCRRYRCRTELTVLG